MPVQSTPPSPLPAPPVSRPLARRLAVRECDRPMPRCLFSLHVLFLLLLPDMPRTCNRGKKLDTKGDDDDDDF